MLQPLEGSALTGLCWTPDTPAAPGGWPLLVFLHGYDEAAPLPAERALTRHGPLNPANPSWVLETFAIVAPQLPEAGDHWLDYADDVLAIHAQVQRDHACDSRRCYLSGFSYGGNGVFDIAAASPERWAASWPVDPTRLPRDALDGPVWLSIGQVARRLEMRFVETLNLAPAGPEPQGDRLYLDEGADHVGSARLAYRDRRIYDWLLRQRLAG